MKKRDYPHCVLCWKVDVQTGVLSEMRLLTPHEFEQEPYTHYSWGCYNSEEYGQVPSDKWFTDEVDERGMEAAIFNRVSNLADSVAPGVLVRLQTDLRRFRIDGWTLDIGAVYGKKHREMIASENYV